MCPDAGVDSADETRRSAPPAVPGVAGSVTWFMVQDQLSDARITVAEDADMFAGDDVDGPFSAYAQAQVIDKHALESTDGKTYAELDQDDPLREVAMSASFLRASLFTSVVASALQRWRWGSALRSSSSRGH